MSRTINLLHLHIPATAADDPLASCVVIPESAAAAATGSGRPAILLSPAAAATTAGLAATSLTPAAATHGLVLGAPWRRRLHWTSPEHGRGGALVSMAGWMNMDGRRRSERRRLAVTVEGYQYAEIRTQWFGVQMCVPTCQAEFMRATLFIGHEEAQMSASVKVCARAMN